VTRLRNVKKTFSHLCLLLRAACCVRPSYGARPRPTMYCQWGWLSSFLFLSVVTLTFDLWSWTSNSSEISVQYYQTKLCVCVAPMWTPSNTCFRKPIRGHVPYDISIVSAVFAQLTQRVPILYSGPPIFHLKIAPSQGPHFYLAPWARRSPQPKRHVDRFSRFCSAHDCDGQTDRPADRETTLVRL